MTGIWILIVGLILLLIVFFCATKSDKKKPSADISPELQAAFKSFAEDVVKPLGIGIEESRIENLKLLSEVPFEDGVFRYYSFEYGIIPTNAVENEQGIVLNSQEILEQAGLAGNPVLLYFEVNNKISEISVLPDSRIAEAGFVGYIENRYAHIKDWEIKEEYSFLIEDDKFSLWENLAATSLLSEASKIRERTTPPLSYSAQYIDTWETEDIEIQSMVFFEGKKELIYSMKTTSSRTSTFRGICVGCSVDELKEKYPKFLSYSELFMEKGPCYGFIPRDQTARYIAFFVDEKKVCEIWIADAFDERSFEEQNGYVDEDIEWVNYDYSDKLTERYAREIYLGKHRDVFDPWQVFHNYIIHEIGTADITDKGLWRGSDDEKLFFIVYRETAIDKKTAVEVKMKKITLEKTTNNAQIWVVTKHRRQEDYK
ncbi:hypothetical protein [Clostridium aminobutyricum]|uniref:Uncharacterized protein n=1 Tax=Clostridium aminobutyricum TaxID=33953 RepID=A0A939DB69_CLOAM|nr:hypothetical protein [Clostridium aminobutyricum]MBN7774485.1 hypothetical protein [Clostridium aminobutyricum]